MIEPIPYTERMYTATMKEFSDLRKQKKQLLKVIQLLGQACDFGEADTIEVTNWDKLRKAYIDGGLIIQEVGYVLPTTIQTFQRRHGNERRAGDH